ncbi:MAG: hypothetical protein HYS17_07900 [Micavibrio aeruginosavorus]|uniref:Uncharacterized protein n=1 Tax=Micavibrio aeruginosavorus TaxID=349221 RepID=A0A7T5R0V3_9BACT|nr:MAG: hypothetical protein HYS17_07900 [Micavibrio aeruginosavorus]
MEAEQDKYPQHFNQAPRRRAEIIKPPNTLKAKVGSGGISEAILNKAQALLENNIVDFMPLAEMYLQNLMRAIETAQTNSDKLDTETLIAGMIYPAVQLKANGGMFHYPLVTTMADRLIQYLEVIVEADMDALEIVLAFHTTIRAVIMGRIIGTGGRHGQELLAALNDACMRYFERYPYNHSSYRLDYTEEF